MPGISFQPWKAGLVLARLSAQTIRPPRQNPIKVGDALSMWERQRSPERRKLGDAVCREVSPVVICAGGKVFLAEELLDDAELEAFALADGFEGPKAFCKFFDHEYGLEQPFEGVVIKWSNFVGLGDFVVELPGTCSQRYGEIVGYQRYRRSIYMPIVLWQDGSCTFSNPGLLELVRDGQQLSLFSLEGVA